MFNSAMIAGISAIIDPRGNDADQMRKILTTFLEHHPWGEVASLDETTRKEVQIIHTLSRRAAQIYEDTMAPGELNAQDKDSVSLLLALRQQGETSASTYSSPVMHDAPTPRQRSLPSHSHAHGNTSWAKYMNTHNTTVMQSPASSGGGLEEDHSQRLLDHWLSANSTLAVGALPDQTIFMPPNSAVGQSQNQNQFGLPLPAAGLGGNFASTPNFVPPPTPALGFMWPNGQANGPGTGDDTLGASHHNSVDTTFSVPPSSGLDGTVLGVGGLGFGEGEGNDEYWNTLIDGILGASTQPGGG